MKKPRKAVTLKVFKKARRMNQARLNRLVRLGRIELQQNGYRGDSTNHHKLVVLSDGQNVPIVRKQIERIETRTKFNHNFAELSPNVVWLCKLNGLEICQSVEEAVLGLRKGES